MFDCSGPALKGYRSGTHRTRPPHETLAEYEPRIDEFGITRLADVTGLDCIGLPVYMAVRPNSRCLAVTQGKGIDRDSAKASALMEAIETWHGERVQVPLRYDSYASLRRCAKTTDITMLPLLRRAKPQSSTPLLWAEGFDLLASEPIWVPFECVSVNFVQPERAGGTFLASSNGLASGNHPMEAVTHALSELIERDSCAVWLARGGMRWDERRIDLKTVQDESLQALLSHLAEQRILVAVWDAISDIGIPTFYCQIVDRPGQPRWRLRGPFSGQGAHLDARVALLRAITEAVQSRLTLIAGSRDDMYGYESIGNPDDAMVGAEVALSPGHRPFQGIDLSTETFEGDIGSLLDGLHRAGVYSVAVVDLSLPGVGVPVVKVVAPGLEHDPHADGYTPGARSLAAMAER